MHLEGTKLALAACSMVARGQADRQEGCLRLTKNDSMHKHKCRKCWLACSPIAHTIAIFTYHQTSGKLLKQRLGEMPTRGGLNQNN